ncbi:hypothetical protein GCM10027168_49430 [Streptomyces capparidis]
MAMEMLMVIVHRISVTVRGAAHRRPSGRRGRLARSARDRYGRPVPVTGPGPRVSPSTNRSAQGGDACCRSVRPRVREPAEPTGGHGARPGRTADAARYRL